MIQQQSSRCPVPQEQQPANEYETLKESWFFRWATLETPVYWRKITWVCFFCWLLTSPIVAASFPLKKFPLAFVLASILGSTLALTLVLLRLYLGWYYIRDRLNSEEVFYEESGWYDGQIWRKPPEVLTRDRLIASYQVAPIMQRMQQTGLIITSVIAIDSLCWFLLNRLSH